MCRTGGWKSFAKKLPGKSTSPQASHHSLFLTTQTSIIMNCPNCNETLVMADRQGVEIDYCPKCRGVWLDRGELDKIIERSADYSPNPGVDPNRYNTHNDQKHYDDHKHYPSQGSGHYNDPHYKHRKKKGFLGDFFDFD